MDIAIPQFSTPDVVSISPTSSASLSPHVVPKGFSVQIEQNSSGFIFAKPIRKFQPVITK